MLDSQKLAYSLQEVAALLGLHLNTVRKHVRDGKIPSKKLGNRVLIPAQALAKWLQNDDPAGGRG
jgi:excisionase family DNA binding protein